MPMSFAGVSGLQGMTQGLPADATEGMKDIPAWGVIIFNVMGVIFNVVFFVVITSVLIQGTTLARAARWLKAGRTELQAGRLAAHLAR